jgi:hypothetical protein
MGAQASCSADHQAAYMRLDGVLVNARVWRVPSGKEDHQFQQYPEFFEDGLGLFERTSDVGLALAGGGIRASCESLGLLQALELRGLLQHVRYVSSISGSSWLNAPFTFLPENGHSLKDFLSPSPCAQKDLKHLTLKALRQVPDGSFVKACAEASVLFNHGRCGPFWGDCLCDDAMCLQVPQLRAWSKATATAYLGPFGLLDAGSVMSPPIATNAFERAHNAVRDTKAKVLPMRGDAPYPIIIANCQIGHELFPLEFTPLYSGIPVDAESSGSKVGGGVIESFGIGSPAPGSLAGGGRAVKNGEEVEITPDKFVSLSFAAGASGGAVTQILEKSNAPLLLEDAVGASQLPVWSPADIHSSANGPAIVGDGGSGGDVAILGLLRRGVKRIILQLTTQTPIPEVDLNDKVAYAEAKAKYFKAESYLPYLFGLDARGADDSHKQVFEKHLLDDLFSAAVGIKYSLKASVQEPVIVHMTNMRVQGNKSYNVPAVVHGRSYEVDVLWCFPDMSSNFRANLPPCTQAKLNVPKCCRPCPQITGSVINAGFPYEPTIAGNFDTALVRLLAENSAYNLLYGINGDILEDFVTGATEKNSERAREAAHPCDKHAAQATSRLGGA